MKIIVTTNEILGPFHSVETLSDRYRADGCDYPFSVVGDATVQDQGDWVPPAPPVPVPSSVSPRQFRQALDTLGMYDSVQTSVAAADNQTKIWWEYATSVDRDNAPLNAMATSLGVTPEQLDDIFRLAATL